MRKIFRLQKYQMTTHNLSFNISKDMSDFNIQLSFKLNIEPPENMYTFNIQPSLKLNVEPQENNSILQPIKQKNEKYQEQNNEQLIQILEAMKSIKKNNEQLIQILEAKKDILFEYVSEEDLDEVQKRFNEINVEDTIVSGIECSKCGETLPPHTVEKHLDVEFMKTFYQCKCVRKVEDEPIKMKINLEVQDEVKDENEKCQEQNDTPKDIVNIQDKVKDTQSCNCLILLHQSHHRKILFHHYKSIYHI